MNKDDYRAREIILNPYYDEFGWRFGKRDFSEIPLNMLKQLTKRNYLKLKERQNESPTTEEFMSFMKKWPGVRAHGYAISRLRPDARVTIEGLEVVDRRLLENKIFVNEWYQFNRAQMN